MSETDNSARDQEQKEPVPNFLDRISMWQMNVKESKDAQKKQDEYKKSKSTDSQDSDDEAENEKELNSGRAEADTLGMPGLPLATSVADLYRYEPINPTAISRGTMPSLNPPLNTSGPGLNKTWQTSSPGAPVHNNISRPFMNSAMAPQQLPAQSLSGMNSMPGYPAQAPYGVHHFQNSPLPSQMGLRNGYAVPQANSMAELSRSNQASIQNLPHHLRPYDSLAQNTKQPEISSLGAAQKFSTGQAHSIPTVPPARSAQTTNQLDNSRSGPTQKCNCGQVHLITTVPHRCYVDYRDFDRRFSIVNEDMRYLRMTRWVNFTSVAIKESNTLSSGVKRLENETMRWSSSFEKSDTIACGLSHFMSGLLAGSWAMNDVVPAFSNVLLRCVDCIMMVTLLEEQVQTKHSQALTALSSYAEFSTQLSSIMDSLDLNLPDHTQIHDEYHRRLKDCHVSFKWLEKYTALFHTSKQYWEKHSQSHRFVLAVLSSSLFKNPDNFPDIASKVRSRYNSQLEKPLFQRVLIDGERDGEN